MVWWLGGSESTSTNTDESCEVVPVRIDRTSPNSRRIGGEITVEAPIEDVWAILTDYDNLSTHVPNLVESRRVRNNDTTRRRFSSNTNTYNNSNNESVQGDGRYKCRLFQRGAQKIVGFEFGASVTLDMTEQIMLSNSNSLLQERKILFKCVDSQFFSEFDGEWKVTSSSENETTLRYVVDVRPKGPVPVVALEWRIREDVPTNLLAVKKASLEDGLAGVLALRASQEGGAVTRALAKVERGRTRRTDAARVALQDGRNRVKTIMERLPQQTNSNRRMKPVPVRVSAQWEDNETMAAYLNKK